MITPKLELWRCGPFSKSDIFDQVCVQGLFRHSVLRGDAYHTDASGETRYPRAWCEPSDTNETYCRRLCLNVSYSSEVKVMIIEIEREEDGRWIAEVPDLPGVMVYSQTRDQAVSKVEALALRAIADRLDHGEAVPELKELFAIH